MAGVSFSTSRCAAWSLGAEWRFSVNRTIGRQRGRFPSSCLPLRARIAEWSGVDSEAFAMALINEYRPGAPIGWHRDAPQYDIVAGISLLSACRMRFRPYRRLIRGRSRLVGRRHTRSCSLVDRRI